MVWGNMAGQAKHWFLQMVETRLIVETQLIVETRLHSRDAINRVSTVFYVCSLYRCRV
jgi:hypothetical protein